MMLASRLFTRLWAIIAILAVTLAACTPPTPPITPALPQTAASSDVRKEAPAPATLVSPVTIALVNGTLIDGTGAPPVSDAVLVFEDGIITAAGPSGSVQIPPGAQVIDVKGAAILPGFFNAHVHNAYNKSNLLAWAQAGVTTVRDLGASKSLAGFTVREETSKDPRYARIIAVGAMITAPDGYPITPWGGSGITVTSPEEARQAVFDLLDKGADLIKIPLESGVIFGRQIPMLTPEETHAVVAAAHERGTRVSVHVTVVEDLEKALDGGVDDIAHMVTDVLPPETAKRVIDSGACWEPTLELWNNVSQGIDVHVIDNLKTFVDAGGKVALGTDYDGYSTPFQLGMPIKEMEWMQEAGMTPMQIITAGTLNAAHVSNQEKTLGSLEPGKIADVLVVAGDPLLDIHALEAVRWVFHNGVMIRSP